MESPKEWDSDKIDDTVLALLQLGYFGISEGYRDIPEIDGWIRRRVRLC